MGQVDHIYLAKQTDIYGSRPASMFEARQTNTMKRNLFSVLEVTYHAPIQKARSSRRNAVWAIITSILHATRFALGNFIRAAHVQRHSDLSQLKSRFDDLPFGVVFWLWSWAGVSRDVPVAPRSDPICVTGLYADQYGRVRQDVCR